MIFVATVGAFYDSVFALHLISRKILLVDDDESLRSSLHELLTSFGYAVESFATAQAVLQHLKDSPTITDGNTLLLIDVHLGDECGLDVQQTAREMGLDLPFVFISGDQNAQNVNRAWRGGALNFVFKPFRMDELLQVLEKAFADQRQATVEPAAALPEEILEKFNRLSPRQKEVLRLVASGLSNTSISAQIGISPRTVKMHRESLMHRLGVSHVADLVRFNDACKDLF